MGRQLLLFSFFFLSFFFFFFFCLLFFVFVFVGGGGGGGAFNMFYWVRRKLTLLTQLSFALSLFVVWGGQVQAYLTKPVIVFIFHRYCFPPARHNRTYSECSLLASLSPWKALCKDVTTFVGWKLHARNHDPHNSIDIQKPRSCFVMQMATEPEKCQVCRFQGRKKRQMPVAVTQRVPTH